jgi:dTDP-4-dehydrorhamnose reductase
MGSGRSRILLTGSTGQVGHELLRALAPLGEVVAPGRAELDMLDAAALRRWVTDLHPAAVVNAAAYTAVDRAESDRETCRRVNAEAPAVLAEAAARVGAVMVHYSTDYVFDGTSSRPYRETDPTGPLNVYGATKLEGERAVAAAGGAYLVLRTSWVYGTRGTNFLRTMLRLLREGDEIRVVDDQVGAPTWSRDIAEATAAILGPALLRRSAGIEATGEASGVYHLAAAGETSWHGFASAIAGSLGAGRIARVVPIPTVEYPTPARRPMRSVLDSSLIRERFGVSLGAWREGLTRVIADLESAGAGVGEA